MALWLSRLFSHILPRTFQLHRTDPAYKEGRAEKDPSKGWYEGEFGLLVLELA